MTFYHIALKIVRVLFRIFNGKMHIEGLENVPTDRPVIIAGTHRSNLDPFLVALAIEPRYVSFMAKDSLFKFKPLAYLLSKAYVFPVNRDKPSASAIKHAVNEMKAGRNLGIFPSGTRYSTEIKGGTAFIQKLSQQAIVPVAIQPSIGFWQFITRKPQKLAFGKPIEFDPKRTYNKETLAIIDAQLAQQFDALDEQLDSDYRYIPPTKKSTR
ncbi:MAG: lysophospholipid acyltransferase family protein [Aerococcaceae bacterium]|nr:lysophospholipid acyltransferase family protein [Aerococcaceae bacterium]